jgi:hypothetical protein
LAAILRRVADDSPQCAAHQRTDWTRDGGSDQCTAGDAGDGFADVKFWIRSFILHIISVVIEIILGIPISFLHPP